MTACAKTPSSFDRLRGGVTNFFSPADSDRASVNVTVNFTDVEDTLPVTDCFADLDTLTAAVEYSGAWDDPDCDAHNPDGPDRYFQFSLSRETRVEISLESGADASCSCPKASLGTAGERCSTAPMKTGCGSGGTTAS